MSVASRTFFHNHKVYQMVDPQAVNNTTANGDTITEPWREGRRLAIIATAGALPNAVTIGVEGLLRSDGTTWENVKAKDGTTDLEWSESTATDVEVAELDLQDLDSDTYKAIRVTVTNGSASNCLVGVVGVISELIRNPSGEGTPELLMIQRYSGGTP